MLRIQRTLFILMRLTCSGGVIEAGSETTSMQLNNMLLGLLSNPEAVVKAHEEIDRVVGSERPPNFTDQAKLPYIRAIIKVSLSSTTLTSQEVMRWRPINKFGQNHFATQVPTHTSSSRSIR